MWPEEQLEVFEFSNLVYRFYEDAQLLEKFQGQKVESEGHNSQDIRNMRRKTCRKVLVFRLQT